MPSGLWKASQRLATTFTTRPLTVIFCFDRVHLAAQLGDLAVDPHLPGADQFLRRAPRRDARARQGALQPHLAHDSAGT